MTTNMYIKVERLNAQARSRVVSLRGVEVSERRENNDKLADETEAKDLEHQTMPRLLEVTAMLQEEAAELREIAKKGDAIVAVLSGLQDEDWLFREL